MHGKHRFLLGVLYRGSRWLDGIIFELLGKKRSHGIAEIIRHSRYFKELRYIILPSSNVSQIDGEHLNEALGLPVIKYQISRGKMGRIESWGVANEAVVGILRVFKSKERELDAVNLADLLKEALEYEA